MDISQDTNVIIENIQFLPEDVIMELWLWMNPCELMTFMYTDERAKNILTSENFLRSFSHIRGYPYFDGINLKQLCDFYNMKLEDLLITAAQINDMYVIEYWYEPKYANYIAAGAVSSNNYDIVDEMLKRGADNFDLLIEMAAENGNPRLAIDILEKRQTFLNNKLYDAVVRNNTRDVLKYTHAGADDLNDALIVAARNGNLNIINILLAKGATSYVNASIAFVQGGNENYEKTALFRSIKNKEVVMDKAIETGDINLIKYFVKYLSDSHLLFEYRQSTGEMREIYKKEIETRPSF